MSGKRGKWTGAGLYVSVGLLAIVAFIASRFTGWQNSEIKPPSSGVLVDRTKVELSVSLRRGPFTIYRYPAQKITTPALVIFGSGDGGWNSFEERFCRSLQNQGLEVIGVDFGRYSQTDYNLETLQADFNTITATATAFFGQHPPPIILSGYSMGAEQSVAIAGGPNRPPRLAGLLLVSPGSRARFGLRPMDHLNVPPTGNGTYALKEYAKKLQGLRIAQWHAGFDPTDSTTWLDSLTVPNKLFVYPMSWHDYRSACPEFLQASVASIGWILNQSINDKMPVMAREN